MNKKKMIILMFGEMGSGKSHLARTCCPTDLAFIEGDDLIPEYMATAVRSFKPVNEDMLKGLVKALKYEVVRQADQTKHGVVVSQALYRDKDRREVISYWQERGFEVTAYYVKTRSFWQNLKQLLKRPKGWRWVIYWLASKPWFQKPTHSHIVLRNNGEKK